MKIIDAHIHLSYIDRFIETAKRISHVHYSCSGLEAEMRDAGVTAAVGMGLEELEGGQGFPDPDAATPMRLNMLRERSPRIYSCAGINPHRLSPAALNRLEKELLDPQTVGIKIYLGYYYVYPMDSRYRMIYEMAAKYKVPVVFHTGDTFSEKGLLKFAHPLAIDEVAVRHPDVTFILAHFGDPWMLDGAEIVYKNQNVYADLSGLIVGDQSELTRIVQTPHFFDHFKHALAFADSYDKLLFGSDWPLIPIKPYISFIQSMIPEEHHEKVFYQNALKVFSKMKPL
ncbi:TatD family hydrolase [Alkalicoccus luteus]|uniref:Amidohydrolase n=1 Tax=Alkalicoccus luteus TaxID=1237094 RepID=A0A969PPL9_9BACI|nr:amidohydrolase [Alkalicoccus luteus]